VERPLSILECAERYRILPRKTSKIEGPYRVDVVPFLKEIYDVLEPGSGYEEVVVQKPAQSGMSEVGNNVLFWALHEGQGPCMLVLPSDVKARNYGKKRINPMIECSPELRRRQILDRNKVDSISEKNFLNATLSLVGAQTSTGLKADPVRILILDEITSYPLDVDNEGDPVELAYQRTKTFQRTRIILLYSTPGNLRTCRVHKKYLESDQRKLFVPCPHCKEKQVLRWERLIWPEGRPEEARYKCMFCRELIDHSYKNWMIQNREWRATFPERKIAGFHFSALVSPVGVGDDWATLAKRWIEAGKDTIKLKSFYNNELAEPWDDSDEVIEWKDLYERTKPFHYTSGMVPDPVRFLTMGVDVQKNYLAFEIVGWTPDKTSYSIQYDELEGDTRDDEVWQKLLTVIESKFYCSRGIGWTLAKVAIDTGYRVDRVYSFLRGLNELNRERVHAVDGRSSTAMSQYVGTPSHIDVDINGRKVREGLKILPVGTGVIKGEIYSNLKIHPNDDGSWPKGFCHFPEDYSERYYQMLTAEQLQLIRTRTGERWDWQKIRRRNEALDCRVYARAMAYHHGLDTLPASYWTAIDRKIQLIVEKRRKEQK
jgi:phage terminase large subunit GpA-like protein